MGHVIKTGLALAALAGAAYLYKTQLEPRPDTPPAPPPARSATELPRLPGELRTRLAGADELEAGRILREAWARYGSGEHAAAFGRFRRLRGDEARARLAAEAEKLRRAARFKGAAGLVQRYLEAWRNSPVEKEMADLLDEIREEQSALLTRRDSESRALFRDGNFEAARLALHTEQELEEPYVRRLRELSEGLERRIRIASLPHLPGRIPTGPLTPPEPGPEPVVQKPPPAEPPPPRPPEVDPQELR
ncbi:MAG: hypothetical protein ACE5JG_10780, partial [Planctomycetota bacterium]